MGKVNAAAAALLAIGVIMAVMMTSAYDYDQTYIANATYFGPEDIRVAGYCNEETVSIWVNTSVCLLYTSPSPRDRTRSRMPSSA